MSNTKKLQDILKNNKERVFSELNDKLCEFNEDELFWLCSELLISCKESRADERDFKDSLMNTLEFLDS